jgi:alpha/beta superfamily hydrolase
MEEAADVVRRATRFDAQTRVRETVGFFDGDDGLLYGCTYLPADDSYCAVVVCSPLLAELQTSYRREVLLSRSLAAAGAAVQRFHYRGAGNSDGSPEQQTLDRLRDDALAAATHIQTIGGDVPLAFVGTRLGGHVAVAAAAAVSRTSPVAIMSPVIDMRAYFRSVLRGYLFGLVKEGQGTARTVQDVLDDLKRHGIVDVLGYPLSSQLYDSFIERSLEEELQRLDGRVLLLSVGDSEASMRRSGTMNGRLEIRSVAGEEVWWFGGGATLRQGEATTTEAIVSSLGTWIHERFERDMA